MQTLAQTEIELFELLIIENSECISDMQQIFVSKEKSKDLSSSSDPHICTPIFETRTIAHFLYHSLNCITFINSKHRKQTLNFTTTTKNI